MLYVLRSLSGTCLVLVLKTAEKLGRLPRGFIARYHHAQMLYQSRQSLLHLTDRELDDIGITRAEADAEAGQPFWQDPTPWIDNSPIIHGDRYVAGRPATAIRSFYQERYHHLTRQ